MTRHAKLVICLIAALTEAAFGQLAYTEANDDVSATASAPVAFVYVSSSPPAITITRSRRTPPPPMAGSLPCRGLRFRQTCSSWRRTGNIFSAQTELIWIPFSVSSDGTLKQVASIDAQGFNTGSCGGPWVLFVDRTGATLYDNDIYSDCANHTRFNFSALADRQANSTSLELAALPVPSLRERSAS